MSWERLYSRKMGLLKGEVFGKSVVSDFEKFFGLGIAKHLLYFDGSIQTGYVDPEDDAKLKAFLRQKISPAYLRQVLKSTYACFDGFMAFVKEVNAADFSGKNNQELAKTARKVFEEKLLFYPYMWLIWFIDAPLMEKAEKILFKHAKPAQVNKSLTNLLAALKEHDYVQEKIELLNIAASDLKQEELRQEIKSHAQKYAYMPMYDYDFEPFSEEHFLTELQTLSNSNPGQELEKIKQEFAAKKQLFEKTLKTLNLSKDEEDFFKSLNEFAFTKDYRNEIRAKESFYLRKFYQEIAQRAGLPLSSLLFLLESEIEAFLEKGELNKKVIEERHNGFVAYFDLKKPAIYTGKDMQPFLNELKASKKEDHVTGTMAFPGIVVGTAKIVKELTELSKIQQGDILITHMTRPEFVPSLQKVAAIATDEGGMLCHAAIISRELQVPCIVGTKNATKVFKDGDKVEVDAEKGIVRKLE